MHLSKNDSKSKALEIVEDENIESMAYFDTEGLLSKHYGIVGVPTAFIIDPEGIIKDISFGLLTADEILNKLQK